MSKYGFDIVKVILLVLIKSAIVLNDVWYRRLTLRSLERTNKDTISDTSVFTHVYCLVHYGFCLFILTLLRLLRRVP